MGKSRIVRRSNQTLTTSVRFVIGPKVNNTGQACGKSLPMFGSVLFLATRVTQIVEHKSKLTNKNSKLKIKIDD